MMRMKSWGWMVVCGLLMVSSLPAAAEPLVPTVLKQKVAESKEAHAELLAHHNGVEGIYDKFELDTGGCTLSFPYWRNIDKPAFAPWMSYVDINNDDIKEIVIYLTLSERTGAKQEEVHVLEPIKESGGCYHEVLVDNPVAIAHKNVKSKLTTKLAEVLINGKTVSVQRIEKLKMKKEDLYPEVAFSDEYLNYQIAGGELRAYLGGHVSFLHIIGELVIGYEKKDGMYQSANIKYVPFQSGAIEPTTAPVIEFSGTPVYGRQILHEVEKFSEENNVRVALPNWVPAGNPYITAEYIPSQHQLSVNFQRREFVGAYLHVEVFPKPYVYNYDRNPHYTRLKLASGEPAFFRYVRPPKPGFVVESCSLEFNRNGVFYALWVNSKMYGIAGNPKDVLLRIANSMSY
ncbi:hypothetical protein [Paenibacillus cremeus]|uniref:DUF4367 domain-containing protein n=1 Tax=Paenibacillus cremeus TaxID=2163881 RepID=A0A559K490_9BACL|nr:hypothetical protein [Paenibacillus cremeus]TVY06910.1 hypothetical protein FPZ49_26715 [Paenibacillus cremeus]